MSSRSEQFVVEHSLPSTRLDVFLREKFPAVSRGTMQRLIEQLQRREVHATKRRVALAAVGISASGLDQVRQRRRPPNVEVRADRIDQ